MLALMAKKANKINCPNVGLTQLKALTDPSNIHSAATTLAAKFKEERGRDSIFNDDSDKASSFVCMLYRNLLIFSNCQHCRNCFIVFFVGLWCDYGCGLVLFWIKLYATYVMDTKNRCIG